MKSLLSSLAVCAALCTPALASGAPEGASGEGDVYLANGVFTYELYEATVEHVDLFGCPAQFDTDVVFCRMTLASDLAHVFVFALDGDQRLLAVKSYELDDGFLPF